MPRTGRAVLGSLLMLLLSTTANFIKLPSISRIAASSSLHLGWLPHYISISLVNTLAAPDTDPDLCHRHVEYYVSYLVTDYLESTEPVRLK